MPHIIVSHSPNIKNVKFDLILKAINEKLVDICQAQLISCQGRHIAADGYVVGDGDPNNAYFLVDIIIMPGRSKEKKDALGDAVNNILEQYLLPKLNEAQLHCQPRVHIREAEESYYFSPWVSPTA